MFQRFKKENDSFKEIHRSGDSDPKPFKNPFATDEKLKEDPFAPNASLKFKDPFAQPPQKNPFEESGENRQKSDAFKSTGLSLGVKIA
jgi:hypothetical protein